MWACILYGESSVENFKAQTRLILAWDSMKMKENKNNSEETLFSIRVLGSFQGIVVNHRSRIVLETL